MTADERHEVASAFILAHHKFLELHALAELPLISWLRPYRRLKQEHAHRTIDAAELEVIRAGSRLVSFNVGAGSAWGLFSSGRSGMPRVIEDVLEAIPDARAVALISHLKVVRAHVELGRGAEELALVEMSLASLAAEYPELHDFLPLHVRPHVTDTQELERDTRLIRFMVVENRATWGAQYPHIYLHDVVSRLRGSGLGTAALQELCAHADRKSLPILAKFMPNDEDSRSRLAQWYYRHGFRQGERSPNEWTDDEMRREPGP